MNAALQMRQARVAAARGVRPVVARVPRSVMASAVDEELIDTVTGMPIAKTAAVSPVAGERVLQSTMHLSCTSHLHSASGHGISAACFLTGYVCTCRSHGEGWAVHMGISPKRARHAVTLWAQCVAAARSGLQLLLLQVRMGFTLAIKCISLLQCWGLPTPRKCVMGIAFRVLHAPAFHVPWLSGTSCVQGHPRHAGQ